MATDITNKKQNLSLLTLIGLTLYLAILILSGCTYEENKKVAEQELPLFQLLDPAKTGVQFANYINESVELNYFKYNYLYNGGGVATGDINNDNLPDIFFTSNQGENKLFLNKGGLVFEDISQVAGISGFGGWSTGVSMVDINDDGWLDIYVCRSGYFDDPAMRTNLLYINNKNQTFSESAEAYGLNDGGQNTQAYFFDFDKDNDLDMYLVSHRVDFQNTGKVVLMANQSISAHYSDKLYRNDGKVFTDITSKAGIANYTWGLSASIGDFNNDGWEDIFIANDFLQPDILYINNKNGTFTNRLPEFMKHTSFYSMGSDMADINNDGYLDLYVLDMVSEDHKRSKRLMAAMSNDNFWSLVNIGYYYQYMLNTLQLNNGNGSFSEISQLAGVNKTDWSWAPLFADFDLDGWVDLFVTNGIKRDVTDNDFKITLAREVQSRGNQLPIDEVMNLLPATRISNYIFRNKGNLTFEKSTEQWGINTPVNSNGCAYADLDNDGDLDLVVNNLDEVAYVYENRLATQKNIVEIKLEGPVGNQMGIGASVVLETESGIQQRQNYRTRGFQSSVSDCLLFGLGNDQEIKAVIVTWPDGKVSKMDVIKRYSPITVSYQDAEFPLTEPDDRNLLRDISAMSGFDFLHQENDYDDFVKEILIPHRQSQNGPCLSVGDVNADGMEDVFVGGAAGFPGALFLQNENGQFAKAIDQPWNADLESEDVGSLLFDADNDNDLDLYVVSGGNEFDIGDKRYADRIYLNNGKGKFTKSSNALPLITSSGQAVVAGDIDNDGDLDLFVGGRVVPGKYPYSPRSFLLRNDGGKFTDITEQWAPSLAFAGMITSAVFSDFTGDGKVDLVVAGEWMPVKFMENTGHQFVDVSTSLGLEKSNGWWYSITSADLNQDNIPDFILGNIGKNCKFKASEEHPFHVYSNDFDQNGSNDIVLSYEKNEQLLPVRGRECSSQQMPFISTKYRTFASFAESDLQEIYGSESLQKALHLEAYQLGSCLLLSKAKGEYSIQLLPNEAQFSPIRSVIVSDIDGDGNVELALGGNMHGAEVETVRYDASIGLVLLGDGTGQFRPLPVNKSGLYAPGDVRQMSLIRLKKEKIFGIIVANNQGKLQLFESNLKKP